MLTICHVMSQLALDALLDKLNTFFHFIELHDLGMVTTSDISQKEIRCLMYRFLLTLLCDLQVHTNRKEFSGSY